MTQPPATPAAFPALLSRDPVRLAAEVVLEEAESTAGLSDEELRESGYSRVCTHCLEQLAAALRATPAEPPEDLAEKHGRGR